MYYHTLNEELRRRFGNTCIQRGAELLDESLLGLDIVVWALVQSEVNGMMGGAGA